MNQILAGSAAFVVVLVMWGLGKRPNKKILLSTDASGVAEINRSQVELVSSFEGKNPKKIAQSVQSETTWQEPKTARDRADLQIQLRQLMNSGPEERLQAIETCIKWGDKTTVAFLKRGLKDSDSRVVIASAIGIKQQKNNKSLIQEKLPPRNVALMR